MKNIFGAKIPQRLPKDKYKLNTDISKQNQLMFGTKNVKVYRLKIWNSHKTMIKD